MSNFSRFLEIRRAYADVLPEWMDDYAQTGDMRQDPYFMDWQFTPIEQHVWSDIRYFGLPFFPQMPVLNYFIDFGCPFLKIGIECDGKAWHDHDLDKARDARLAKAGWMIFRIEGHECFRVVEPWIECQDYEEEDRRELLEQFFMTTSEGVLYAINDRYFKDERSEKYAGLIDHTLFEHRSTPETFPVRRPINRDRKPARLSDTLIEYFAKLMARAKKVRKA